MPSVTFPFFTGPSNTQRSRLADASKTENHFLERPGPSAKAQSPSYLRPVLRLFASAVGPIRAMYAANGRAFFVGGAYLYELNANGTATEIGGPMVLNGNPATISQNSVGMLFIVSGGEGYLYDTNTDTFSNITSPTFPNHAVSGTFLSSFFLALSGVDGRVQLSDIQGGEVWNASDFFLVSDFADQVIQIARINDNLCLMGGQHSQLWWANGNASLPFAPLDAGLIEHGIDGVYTAVVADNHLMLTGRDEQGSQIVWRLNGVTPERISTSAVEYSLSLVQDRSQARAFAFQMQGHLFYVLYIPGLDFSWVYDLSTGDWYEWGHWIPSLGRSIPFLGVNGCQAFGKNFCGDRQSGAIYELSMTATKDNLAGPLLG